MIRLVGHDRGVLHSHQHALVGLRSVRAVAQHARGDVERLRNTCVTQNRHGHHRDDLGGAVHLLHHAMHLHSVPDVLMDPGFRSGQGAVAALVGAGSVARGADGGIDSNAAPGEVIILKVEAMRVGRSDNACEIDSLALEEGGVASAVGRRVIHVAWHELDIMNGHL